MKNRNNGKPVTKFKDLLKDLDSFESKREDVNKNTSSENELSMIRFLLNQRNQFRR